MTEPVSLLSEDELAGLKALIEGAWNRSAPGHWLLSESDHLKADLCQAFAAHIAALTEERDGLTLSKKRLHDFITEVYVGPLAYVATTDTEWQRLADMLLAYGDQRQTPPEETGLLPFGWSRDPDSAESIAARAIKTTARTSALKEAAEVARKLRDDYDERHKENVNYMKGAPSDATSRTESGLYVACEIYARILALASK